MSNSFSDFLKVINKIKENEKIYMSAINNNSYHSAKYILNDTPINLGVSYSNNTPYSMARDSHSGFKETLCKFNPW